MIEVVIDGKKYNILQVGAQKCVMKQIDFYARKIRQPFSEDCAKENAEEIGLEMLKNKAIQIEEKEDAENIIYSAKAFVLFPKEEENK